MLPSGDYQKHYETNAQYAKEIKATDNPRAGPMYKKYRIKELSAYQKHFFPEVGTQWLLSDTNCQLPPEALNSSRRLDIELAFLQGHFKHHNEIVISRTNQKTQRDAIQWQNKVREEYKSVHQILYQTKEDLSADRLRCIEQRQKMEKQLDEVEADCTKKLCYIFDIVQQHHNEVLAFMEKDRKLIV